MCSRERALAKSDDSGVWRDGSVQRAGAAMSMLALAVRRGAHVFRDAARATGVRPLASFHCSAQVRTAPHPAIVLPPRPAKKKQHLFSDP